MKVRMQNTFLAGFIAAEISEHILLPGMATVNPEFVDQNAE